MQRVATRSYKKKQKNNNTITDSITNYRRVSIHFTAIKSSLYGHILYNYKIIVWRAERLSNSISDTSQTKKNNNKHTPLPPPKKKNTKKKKKKKKKKTTCK